MKLLVLSCLVAMVAAAPRASPASDVQLIRYENENPGTGKYKFAFEQSDGTAREEQGDIKNKGLENESIAVQGRYNWVGPDSVSYEVSYVADENGYQPRIEEGPGGSPPRAVIESLLKGWKA